jgi:hypothetical protein
MKKLLPIIVSSVFLFTLFVTPPATFAQAAPQQLQTTGPTPTDSRWVIDPEVTFIGKNARRSGDLLDWTLQNYNWVCVKQIANGQCDNSNNPIAKYWSLIVLYIVVPMLFLVILITASVIIITRGKSLTIMRFIPRFIAVVLLIVFSYSLLQFFYQFTDLIQGFFLRSNINQACPPNCISDKDLLYVGWDYTNFVGLRLLGDKYAESAFISLLLTKLTALTYFVMVFLLLVRKIILWFFIIVSPIFPILLLYYPVRNTGKIWIGEFFRWLLYAPLFAIFLNGLVYLWRNQIPLVFANPNIGNANAIEYPTAVNILLGGPRQVVSPTNSVNLVETFALYVVSLIMLWIVILLPWILLQIFLDYAQNFAPGDTAVMKTLVNMAGRGGGGGSSPPSDKGGAAISLPFAKKFSIPIDLKPGPIGSAKEINVQGATLRATFTQPITLPGATVNAQVLSSANIKLPSMRDIARFDVAMTSRDTSKQQEVSKFSEQLVRIANPVVVTNTIERSQIEKVRETIMQNSARGNQVASSIMNAANSVSRSNVQASTNEIKNVLSQIANPASTSSLSNSSTVVNRDKLAKLHDTLQKQSKESTNQLASSLLSVNQKSSNSEVEKIRDQLKIAASQGDKTASSVISTINNASQQSQASTQTRSILKQIANPASVTNTAEREKFTQLHNALEKESKEKNNSLASSILKVSDSTSVTELSKISEQLKQSKENTVVQSVNNVMQQNQSTTHVKSVLQEVANPNAATTNVINKDKVNKMHETLQKASTQGNQLASSILKVNEKTSTQEIEALQQKIQEAKLKGEPLAAELSAISAQSAQTTLPSVNRVQTVKKEDYQAVKDMWKQNYQNLEVPQGMAGTRADWVKDDISSIDETIGLLSSQDEDKVQQGMDQVSNLLPFLLVGGFSQTEIIEYLKAKQEAAKDVSKMLVTEEEDKVSVSTKSTQTAQTMAATMTEENTSSSSQTSSQSSSNDDEENESPLTTMNVTTNTNITNYTQPEISNEILNMVNVKIPKLRDIAQYETHALRKDTTKTAEIDNMKSVLGNIADPAKISDTAEREKFEKVRETLLSEQQKGNPTANLLLNAAQGSQGKSSERAKSVLSQIADPSLAKVETDKKRFTQLHESLKKASQEGNQLATAILATKQSTSAEEIDSLKSKIQDAKGKGDVVTSSVLPDLSDLPSSNQLQPAAQQDYDEVKKMWEENYRTLPVPAEYGSDRVSWITADKKYVDETIALLKDSDTDKQSEGQKRVADIMPMLLLGGFSTEEVVRYLGAKSEAGTNVIVELQKDEEGKVTVAATKDNKQEENALKVEEKTDDSNS